MKNYEELMYEFMERHNQYRAVDATANIPEYVKVLRLRLMMEELGELAVEMHENNLIGIADALADLVYVVIGTAVAYGIPFDSVFREVHRSNMTKTPLNENQKGGKVGKCGYEPPQLAQLLGVDK